MSYSHWFFFQNAQQDVNQVTNNALHHVRCCQVMIYCKHWSPWTHLDAGFVQVLEHASSIVKSKWLFIFFSGNYFVLYRPSCTSLSWIPHFRRQFAVKVCRHNRGRGPLIFVSCCICCILLQRQELEGVLSSGQVLLHLITFNRSIEAT